MKSDLQSITKKTPLYYFVFILLALFITPSSSNTPCPNSCNGRGLCRTSSRVCECYDGFEGPDCSLLSCPRGIAWADFSVATDDAHNTALCSNMGICDHSTGTCLCKVGFEGISCERMSCPSGCNTRGKCMSMKNYATTVTPGTGTIDSSGIFQLTPDRVYENPWDADKIFGCVCDDGYSGPDCSLQTCPLGDDPLTGTGTASASNPAQFNDIQRIACKADGGTFTLSFRGKTTKPIAFNAQASAVRSAIEELTTVNGVTVVMYGSQTCLETGTSFTIEFTQDFGNVPLLVPDSSRLNLAVGTPTIEISKQQAGSKEDLECSRRGLCDTTTGSCTCSTNYATSNGYNLPGTRGDCGYVITTIQGCPGGISCSAHGGCSGFPTFVCDCNQGWTGADCSEKTCPVGTSWFSLPSGNNEAHLFESVECSDMGICDKSAGTCSCMPGFTGSSCNRLLCPGDPNACSGHGSCQDMMTLATNSESNGVNLGITYGLIPNNPLTWDFDRVFGCNCDEGWGGYDCSLQLCPFGDDPHTTGQLDEIQSLSCINQDGVLGAILLTFRGETTLPIPSTATSAEVKAALEALSTITTVQVELGGVSLDDRLCTATGNTFFVSFQTEHGDLPIMTFSIQDVDTFNIQETVKGNKENIECSGRGLCDPSTGSCFCFQGYGSSDGMSGPGALKDCGYIMPLPFSDT